jgi:hypothetical protein
VVRFAKGLSFLVALKKYTKAISDLCVQDTELLVSGVISLSIECKASERKEIHKEEWLTVWDRMPLIFIPFPLFFFFFLQTFRFTFPFMTIQ